jgi:hypothetical protein
MSAITRLMAISDCVALDDLRDGAGLKGIAFISSQVVPSEYQGVAHLRRQSNKSNTQPTILDGVGGAYRTRAR